MGSGTTAIVAMGLQRNYIGIDISPDYCAMAEKRIKRNKIESELLGVAPKTLFQSDK
jgi:modification methylase